MNNLNSVIIEGNLVRDPVVKETPGGAQVCKFSVALNRYYKVNDERQQEVSFFSVETWNKVAQSCAEYLEKGRGVRVVGRLKQERWTGPDESKHEKVVIVAEHVEFKPRSNWSAEELTDQEKVAESAVAESAAVPKKQKKS